MKKLIYLIVLTLILGLVLTGCLLSNVGQVPTTEQSGITYLTKHTEDDPFTTDLIADGGDPASATDVGDVLVWNDGDYLYVKYVLPEEGDWRLTGTHLHVATSPGVIPQKKGNPIPGKFEYKGKHAYETEVLYEIPLTWDPNTTLFIAAHAKVVRPIEDCWETVWQIGDVEVDDGFGQLTNYCDEFNYAYFYEGLGPLDPPFTNPFVVGITPTKEFPWISLWEYVHVTEYYATDFKVQWSGELPFGGKLTVSWSPGTSATETKIIMSMDDEVPVTFAKYGYFDSTGWRNYPLVQSDLELNPIGGGSHEIRFQHTTGDGAIWDWVLLEKPCELEETAWGAGFGFPGANWATYCEYTVQGWDLTGTYVWRFLYTGSPAGMILPNPYDHDMFVTIHQWDTTGYFEGEGGYPATGPPYSVTWEMTGNVDGDDVEFYIDYDGSDYYVKATGTIAPDGSMSGTCETHQGSPYNWLTISGFATRCP